MDTCSSFTSFPLSFFFVTFITNRIKPYLRENVNVQLLLATDQWKEKNQASILFLLWSLGIWILQQYLNIKRLHCGTHIE